MKGNFLSANPFIYVTRENIYCNLGISEMGNEISKVALQQDIVKVNNQAIGLNADGSKPGTGFCESGVEKAMLFGGAAMPAWQYKGKIGEAWQNRSWQNVRNAYKQGFHNAGLTLRHPGNYYDIEFVNSKVSKIEGIMSKNMPKLPQDFAGNQAAKDLFEQLTKAKNPREFSDIVRNNQKTYKKLKNILSRTAPEELTKLQNVAKYNEMYGDLLKDFKTAKTQAMANRLPKGAVSNLHQRFANARVAENKWIQQTGKAGKKGVGVLAKSGAKMSKGVKSAMAASKTLRTFNRGVGKAGGWLCAGVSAVTAGLDIYTAVAASPEGEKAKNGWRQAGKSGVRLGCELGAMAVGQWAGAALGQVLIPIPGVGAAIGGFVGSFIGMWAGSKLADNIPFTKKSVAEEIQEKQREEINKQVSEAVENDDLETVYNYANQFKEQVVGEDGQAVTDEDGNPVYQIIKVSDDEKEQKEFEERVANLDNYVMSEVAKREEAEQLKQQAEEAEKLRKQQMNNGGSLSYGTTYAPAGYAPAQTTPAATGYGPAGTSQTSGYGVNGNGSFGSYTTDWRNPAWQDSLGKQYNNSNFYTFNPSNYTPLFKPIAQNESYAPAA